MGVIIKRMDQNMKKLKKRCILEYFLAIKLLIIERANLREGKFYILETGEYYYGK